MMDSTVRQIPSGLIGWARRMRGHVLSIEPLSSARIEHRSGTARSRSGESLRPATDLQLQELSLALAGCTDPRTALPPLLQPLERALNLAPDSGLLLALSLPGQTDLALIHTTATVLPTGLPAFLRYQFSGPLLESSATLPQLMPIPGSRQMLHLVKLEIAGLKAGLLLISAQQPGPVLQQRLTEIATALSRGLGIWSGHQQWLEQAIKTERRAHAAELHDSLAQILGYLRLTTSRLDARCSKCNQPELQALAADLSQQTKHAYRLMRDLISSSRLTLEGGSLHSALAAAVQEFEQRSGLVFELDDRCQTLEPDENTAIQLVMIVREALCNAVRHAHASHLRVQLLPDQPDTLRLRIEDNGQGIDPSRRRPDSFGLGIMQERAGRIGAQLEISERPGGGTRIELKMTTATLNPERDEP